MGLAVQTLTARGPPPLALVHRREFAARHIAGRVGPVACAAY